MRAFSGNTDIFRPHLNFSPYKGEADIVAGARIERASQGYEPCEMPLLYPALVYYSKNAVFATYKFEKRL